MEVNLCQKRNDAMPRLRKLTGMSDGVAVVVVRFPGLAMTVRAKIEIKKLAADSKERKLSPGRLKLTATDIQDDSK